VVLFAWAGLAFLGDLGLRWYQLDKALYLDGVTGKKLSAPELMVHPDMGGQIVHLPVWIWAIAHSTVRQEVFPFPHLGGPLFLHVVQRLVRLDGR